MEFGDNLGKSGVSKIVASFVTIAVVVLLIMAGPAQAFTLSFDGISNASPKQGEIISFIAKLSIESNEFMNLNPIDLYDDESGKTLCTFTPDGKNTTECVGIGITNLENGTSANGTGYGYGYEYYQDYGYGYGPHTGYNGNYVYNVTIDTSKLSTGTYNLILKTLQAGDYTYYTHNPLTITILADTQQHADTPTVTIEEGKTEVVFNQNSSNVQEIVVNSSILSSTEITLNMSSLLNTTDSTVNVTNAINLTRETTSSEYTAEIPAGTVISGPDGWDGSIVLPTVESNSAVSLSGADTQVVVKMGGDFELNFSNPIKISLSGMSGKSAAWARDGVSHNINTTCDADDPTGVINPILPRECYNNTGSDLVIWTYHFTEFAAYTASAAVATTTTQSNSYGTPRKMAAPITPADTPAPSDTTTGTPETTGQNVGGGSFLTGFVVGVGDLVKNPISWVVIAAVVIIGGGAIALRFRKNPGKSKNGKKSRSKKSRAKDEDLDADMD
ncbi:MAG: hypothetical protein WCK90_01155 [archaeon]